MTSSSSSSSSCDFLMLSSNPNVHKMMAKKGESKNKPEIIKFTDCVTKINKREKEQMRVLLITDRAVYNLMPNDPTNCKRRIPLHDISSVSASDAADEFVIHVPKEYDYRFKTPRKQLICDMLEELYQTLPEESEKKKKKKRLVSHVAQSNLKDVTVTKAMARLLQREDEWRSQQESVAKERDSDNEEKKAQVEQKGDEVTQLLVTQEKVRVEDFDLLKVIGRGAFGKVMQVKKKSDGKIYAMKILKKRALKAKNQVEHTKAERAILEASQHPYLMTLRYAFQNKEKLYFVLDYVSGGELFFHLKQCRRFSEDATRIIVAQVALALGHLHSLSIVYRDLKPENILLDDEGHVCLTDFGLSRDMSTGEEAHTFCGTPEYLAPEIVAQTGHNKAVDWWALGILLYELTVGIPPFYSQNVNKMYENIQHAAIRFPPFLSDECKSVIVSLLNRDPQKRLGSENDIEDIKKHPFFKPMDWDKLMKKQITPLYKPKVKSGSDTSNFDKTFTDEPVVDSLANPTTLGKTVQADAFEGFTFVPTNGALH